MVARNIFFCGNSSGQRDYGHRALQIPQWIQLSHIILSAIDLRQFLSWCGLSGLYARSPLPDGRVDLGAAAPEYSYSGIAIGPIADWIGDVVQVKPGIRFSYVSIVRPSVEITCKTPGKYFVFGLCGLDAMESWKGLTSLTTPDAGVPCRDRRRIRLRMG